jgi:hypothetical protein
MSLIGGADYMHEKIAQIQNALEKYGKLWKNVRKIRNMH